MARIHAAAVAAGVLVFATGSAPAQTAPTSYVVSRLAGAPVSHRDGPIASARFDSPTGVARDRDGNLYVTDSLNFTIRKISPEGMVSTLAGSPGESGFADGPGATARFQKPLAIGVDGFGTVYVADNGRTIRKITPAGQVTTLAGSPTEVARIDGDGAAARFSMPLYGSGLAVHPMGGPAFVNDTVSIRLILPSGSVGTLLTSVLASGIAVDDSGAIYWLDQGYVSKFNSPAPFSIYQNLVSVAQGMTIDGAGNIFVSDIGGRIAKITPKGVVTAFAGSPLGFGYVDGVGENARFSLLGGLAADKAGNLYVADTGGHMIRKITPAAAVTTLSGSPLLSEDGQGARALFDSPVAAAVDVAGNVYVADEFAYTIRKVTSAGVVTTLAGTAGQSGSADGTGSTARFSRPSGIAIDPAGVLFVGDGLTIRRVTAAGVVTTFAGSASERGSVDGVGAAARFSVAGPLAIGPDGSLYVADQANNTIRKITSAGVVTTLAGNPQQQRGSIDGLGAAASFGSVRGIAVDVGGSIYAADGSALRKITPAGLVTTLAGSGSAYGHADGKGSTARFTSLSGVAMDARGVMYATDSRSFLKEGGSIRRITTDGVVTTIAGVPDQAGFVDGPGVTARFSRPNGIAVDAAGTLYISELGNRMIRKAVPVVAPPLAITSQPQSQRTSVGASLTLSVSSSSTASTLHWERDGLSLVGATTSTLALTNLQPADAGIYVAVATEGSATATSRGAIIGVTTTNKVFGAGRESDANVLHPNGHTFDQVLVTGPAESITADYSPDPALNQITRTSFIDVDGDIVQVEFGGPGTLSLVLAGAGAPAAPEKYNQPNVEYVKGHAGIVIVGADERTNVSVFSVGRATAFDRTGKYNIVRPIAADNDPANNGSPLFQGVATPNNGVADIAFIAISSSDGKFGGVRTANANYFASRGCTGLYAPGVQFTGPVYLGDVIANDSAKPVIIIGSALGPTGITGGDMRQPNGQSVEVSGITRLEFRDGQDSHGRLLAMQTNRAVFKQNGQDVTAQIVIYQVPATSSAESQAAQIGTVPAATGIVPPTPPPPPVFGISPPDLPPVVPSS